MIKATYIAHANSVGINWDDPIAVAQYKKEYYEAHKKLKGRKSTSGLNEEGRNLASFVREGINKERDQKIDESKTSRDSNVSTKKASTDSEIDLKRETKDQVLEAHKSHMNNRINILRNQLSMMSPMDKRKHSAEFKAQIAQLREENAAKREELNTQFGEDRDRIQNEYKTEKESQYNKHTENVQTYRNEAEDRYMNALDKIKADSRYQVQKKTSSGRSKKTKETSSNTYVGKTAPEKQLQKKVMSRISSK